MGASPDSKPLAFWVAEWQAIVNHEKATRNLGKASAETGSIVLHELADGAIFAQITTEAGVEWTTSRQPAATKSYTAREAEAFSLGAITGDFDVPAEILEAAVTVQNYADAQPVIGTATPKAA